MKNENNRHALKAFTLEEVREIYNIQKESGEFNFYEEKNVAESILNTRSNYLLTIISIFLLSATSAKTQLMLIIVLWLGFLYCLLMGMAIYRMFRRVDVCLKILNKMDDHHVLPVVRKELSQRKKIWSGVSAINIQGIWIPSVSVAVFLTGGILALCCVLTVG